MFSNLIESSSHTRELKRRGLFFFITTATYAVMLAIAGVASIYAYDTHLEDQDTELAILVNPAIFDPPPKSVPPRNATQPKTTPGKPSLPIREIAMAPVNMPQLAPDKVSSTPNRNLPIPRGNYVIGTRDSDPGAVVGPVGPANGVRSDTGGGVPLKVDVGTPPPVLIEKPKVRIVHKSVINGEAVVLPKPPYPPMAKQMRIQGMVNVQVLIDESGKVVSAKVVSGNPALSAAAQRAAFSARFSPTTLNDQPVKVSGVITYNFILQ